MNGDESGQLAVLTVGLVLVVFAVAGLAIDGTKAFLLQRSLQSSADAATVSAASEIDVRGYYASGGSRLRLRPNRARTMAARVLADRGTDADVEIAATRRSVGLTIRMEMPTGFLMLIGIDSIPVGASARARPLPQTLPGG